MNGSLEMLQAELTDHFKKRYERNSLVTLLEQGFESIPSSK